MRRRKSPRERVSRLSRLGDVLQAVVARRGFDARLRAEMAPLVWSEVAGPQLAHRAKPSYVRDGVLYVVTRSPAWAQELTFLKPQLLEKLNARLGGPVLRDVRFRSGAWRSPGPADGGGAQPGAAGPSGPGADALARVRLDRAERDAIEGLAGFVDDPALRARYRRFVVTGRRLRAWRLAHGWRPCAGCGAAVRHEAEACPACGRAVAAG